MGIIVAIGGGEIGRKKILPDGSEIQTPIETTMIDEFVIKSSGIEHPSILFIGTAKQDAPHYPQVVANHYVNRLGCKQLTTLNLVDTNISKVEICDKIFSADIIYVGGGDTTFMLKIWQQYNLKEILLEAYQKGIVIAGISAGAICWFDWYDNMDDIEDIKDLDIVAGLGVIKGVAVPHYNTLSDDEKQKINDILIKRDITGYAIDDCAAFVYEDGKISTLTCRLDRKVISIP